MIESISSVINANKIWNYAPVKTVDELFNRIVVHLLIQNERSENEEGCRYFYVDSLTDAMNPKVLQCAVGPLLNINHYDEELHESLPIDQIQIKGLVQESNPELHLNFEVLNILQWFQYIHDSVEPNLWYFACYLLWRDMNFLVSYNKDFVKVNDPDSSFGPNNNDQKHMYRAVARLLAGINQKENFREQFLEQEKLGVSPIDFFKNNSLSASFYKIK